jgi:hypothetical protein
LTPPSSALLHELLVVFPIEILHQKLVLHLQLLG